MALRSLPAGAVLSSNDWIEDRREITALSYGYLEQADQARGYKLRRPLRSGEVLIPGQLESPRAVRKGQQVDIVLRRSGIQVRGHGEVLVDGAVGQRIQVRNVSSGRFLEAVVRSPEEVEVGG